jgi:hypothetical protein
MYQSGLGRRTCTRYRVATNRESGGIGRRTGFRYLRAQALQGSSPCSRTIQCSVEIGRLAAMLTAMLTEMLAEMLAEARAPTVSRKPKP